MMNIEPQVFYHFAGLCLIVTLSYVRNKLLDKENLFGVMILGILETLPHEIMHWLVASITGARPYGFSIIPKKYEIAGLNNKKIIYWDFGKVEAYITFYNALFFGLAPLLLLILAFISYAYYFTFVTSTLVNTIAFYMLEYCLIVNSIPSKQDILVAFSCKSWLFYTIIAMGICFFIFTKDGLL